MTCCLREMPRELEETLEEETLEGKEASRAGFVLGPLNRWRQWLS